VECRWPRTPHLSPVKRIASVELATTAEGAVTTKLEALWPWAVGEDGRGLEIAPQDNTARDEQVLEAPPLHRDTVKRGRESDASGPRRPRDPAP
jgi:hypothetical protein